MNEKYISRFWSKVDKENSTMFYNGTRCWEWAAHVSKNGYGVFRLGFRLVLAHRFAWGIANREIPDGLFILHHCDNRASVRKDHLFLGTKKDNSDDMVKKGRRANFSGESNGRSKLTVTQVNEIRQRYESGGVTQTSLAREFDVHHTQIGCIVNFKHWKDE